MTTEEIAKKLREQHEKGTDTTFSFEKYWVRNKEYFVKQAEIY
jgi:hypothetical protein